MIVHLAFDTPTAALHLLRSASVPECFFVHNNFQRSRSSRFEKACLQWISRRAARLLFLEEPVARAAADALSLVPGRWAVIPHPVPEPSIPIDPPSTVTALGPEIVMAGILTQSKGLATLTEAASILRSESPGTLRALPIRVVGERLSGPDPGRYWELIDYRPTPLTDQELDATIVSSRFIVLPYEPAAYAFVTPGTLYRALALGRPVIAREPPSIASLAARSPSPVLTFSEPRQLARLMIRLASMDSAEYALLCASALRLARERLPASLAPAVMKALGLEAVPGWSRSHGGQTQRP